MKADDLKCCGNCHRRKHKAYDPFACIRSGNSDDVCNNWAYDKKTWGDRFVLSGINHEVRNNGS